MSYLQHQCAAMAVAPTMQIRLGAGELCGRIVSRGGAASAGGRLAQAFGEMKERPALASWTACSRSCDSLSFRT